MSEQWQARGSRGADHAAWSLDQLLRARRREDGKRKTWVAFLDAEAAYCRPPRPCILRGLARAGIDYGDWLAIQSILRDIRGCVKVAAMVIGGWAIESGAPQGGSLSTPLFQSTLPELEEELRANKCGVWIGHADRRTFVACLGCVDGLAFVASSASMLRKALRIAQRWAQRVRLRWNIGVKKSAVMLCGRGRSSAREKAESFSLGGQVLPRVTVYKYLGVHITNGGGWSANIKAIRSKCTGRTKEVLTWCQARMCPIPLAERLWRVYAEPAIINATAVMQLTDKQITSLDTVQRAAGRAILEFLPRSPTPAVLLELGWAAWSSLHRVEMARLLDRVTCSPNDITRALMEQMSNSVDTWAHKAAEDIEPWMSDAQLDIKSEWDTPIQQMKESLIEAHFDQLRIDGQAHHNLDSYVSVWWLKTGQYGYNRTLMNCGLCDRAVKAVGRLLVAGQGLRGGDPAHNNEATKITCCM